MMRGLVDEKFRACRAMLEVTQSSSTVIDLSIVNHKGETVVGIATAKNKMDIVGLLLDEKMV